MKLNFFISLAHLKNDIQIEWNCIYSRYPKPFLPPCKRSIRCKILSDWIMSGPPQPHIFPPSRITCSMNLNCLAANYFVSMLRHTKFPCNRKQFCKIQSFFSFQFLWRKISIFYLTLRRFLMSFLIFRRFWHYCCNKISLSNSLTSINHSHWSMKHFIISILVLFGIYCIKIHYQYLFDYSFVQIKLLSWKKSYIFIASVVVSKEARSIEKKYGILNAKLIILCPQHGQGPWIDFKIKSH